jgi:hypothetical protein
VSVETIDFAPNNADEVRALRTSQMPEGSATDGEEVKAYVNRDD